MAARAITASDTAHLHLVRANGSVLHERGRASGGLPGQVSAQLEIGATVTGTVTIRTAHGEVKAKGKGSLHADRYPWEGFTGKATVTKGTGRYRHAHGTFKLDGLFNRRTYAIVAHTRGSIRY